MRVLVYEPVGYGGMQHYTAGLAHGLATKGTDVTVLTNRNAKYSDSDEFRIARTLRDPGAKVAKAVWPFERLYSRFVNTSRWTSNRVGFDVIHLQNTFPLFDSLSLSFIETPVVFTVHDVIHHEPRFWRSSSLARLVYDRVDRIIVHSEHNRDALYQLADVPIDKVDVIPHGMSESPRVRIAKTEARRQLGLPPTGKLALMFGAIRVDKGVDLAIRALCNMPEWSLVVAGACQIDGLLDHYGDLAEQLGVSDRIEWRTAFISDRDLSAFFFAADVVLLPYRPNFESQSGVLFQAYRHQVPVVVSDVGSLGEAINLDQTGALVNPNDPLSIAQGVETANAAGIGVNWAAVLEKYHWNRVAELTLQTYQRARSEKSGRAGA